MRGPGKGHAHPEGGSMNTLHRQSGVTLIDVAAVMCIVTALTVGVMGAQMLIRHAAAKRLVAEMIEVKHILYEFRNRYGMIPSAKGVPRVIPGAINGWKSDGVITKGVWVGLMEANAFPDWGSGWTGNESESSLFWRHARMAGLAIGDANQPYALNAVGGRLGITSNDNVPTRPAGAKGLFSVCSGMIDAQLAKIMDIEIDDGLADSGNFWASPEYEDQPVAYPSPTQPYDSDASANFTVCMAF
jgi:hypothetical protein